MSPETPEKQSEYAVVIAQNPPGLSLVKPIPQRNTQMPWASFKKTGNIPAALADKNLAC